jgi:hypothetical protein
MKLNILVCLFILLLMPMAKGYAQNEVLAIETMNIELWPDYDRPSVLVLLTGMLPADTRFPATVIVPLPKNAQLNAIARIDSRDGIMKSDISSTPGPSNMLMFITTDLQFRVEYYIPYITNGNQRSFDYSWLADVNVNKLQLKIQQPKAAVSFNIKPGAIDITTGQDGLTYHAFLSKAVLAGQSFSARMEYEMITDQLSVSTLPPSPVKSQEPLFPPAATGSGTNLPVLSMIAGGLIIIIGLIWLIVSRRSQVDTHEQHSQNPRDKPQIKFCRKCGEPVDETDKWCSQCGAYL